MLVLAVSSGGEVLTLDPQPPGELRVEGHGGGSSDAQWGGRER